MIVVSILGILAAIVLPEFQNHQQIAKETQAKANLKLLREAIERYALDHNGVAPGYLNNDITITPTTLIVIVHLGSYLNSIPRNPFNNLHTILVLRDFEVFPDSANNISGWIYQPINKTIKLNQTGLDNGGIRYYDY